MSVPGGHRRYVEPHEDQTPIAWRCEMDRKLHPADHPSFVVYIEEIASGLSNTGSIKRHGYYIRRMIVCRACRRSIADLDLAKEGRYGQQAGASQPSAEDDDQGTKERME